MKVVKYALLSVLAKHTKTNLTAYRIFGFFARMGLSPDFFCGGEQQKKCPLINPYKKQLK